MVRSLILLRETQVMDVVITSWLGMTLRATWMLRPKLMKLTSKSISLTFVRLVSAESS